MAPVQGTNIIVLDAEGSDSRERHTRGNATVERKTLAFTLAHANVLMVTIPKRQVRKSYDDLLSSVIWPFAQTDSYVSWSWASTSPDHPRVQSQTVSSRCRVKLPNDN